MIQRRELSRLHLPVTSLQLNGIEETLSGLATHRLCLQNSEVNQDFSPYISEKLENDKILAMWPPEIRVEIQRKLWTEEDGMSVNHSAIDVLNWS